MKQQKKKREKSGQKSKRLPLILLLILAAALISGVILWNTRIVNITIHGNEQYTEEEVKNLIFEKPVETRVLYTWFTEKFGQHKSFPRIDSYRLEFNGLDQVEIFIDENKMMGCINYMGSYLYFDKDGMIVESAKIPHENIPMVEGLVFKKILLYEELETDPEDVFSYIVQLTQKLEQRGLFAETIFYHPDGSFQLKMENIKVNLGDSSYLEEKITELYAMKDVLKGKKGTLHLEDYDIQNEKSSYFFELEEADNTGND